jgi:hypothetical protein
MDAPPQRHRLRFSLLTAILLTTIAGMGVALWRLNGELAPLREEVLRLREEQGRLTIADPNKIYAIRVMTEEPNAWRWRVYLPPHQKYLLHTRLHTIPGRQLNMTADAWRQRLLEARSGSSTNAPNGEFFVETRLLRDAQQPGKWTLHYRFGDSLGSVGAEMKWLDDRRVWSMSSEVDWTQQTELSASAGLDLFMLRQGDLKETTGGGYTVTNPSSLNDTPGVMLWITPN